MKTRTIFHALGLVLMVACSVVSGAEVVILKDGFVIQGNVRKETETIVDKATGIAVPIVKATGLDMIDEGPKIVIFSTHAKQLGAISSDIKLRPDYKAYTMPFQGRKSNSPLPNGITTSVGDFNAKWIRTIETKVVGVSKEKVEQQITHIDPYMIYIVSPTHSWRLTYRTTEWDPKSVRKLLSTHPELAEPDGKCVPMRRIAIAKFMLDAGWLQVAKDELDKLKRDFTDPMPKESQDALDKLVKEIDQATAEMIVREAELALGAGRYKYAAELLQSFPEKTAEPKEVARAAKVGADLKTGQERYDTARRLLRGLIDDVSGLKASHALLAVAGGQAIGIWKPVNEPTAQAGELAAAAARVFAELHPDSAIRIEMFVTLATQAERERAAGREPTKKPDELIATAISGWAKGRNGATPNVEAALKLWAARELILAYQRAETQNERSDVLGKYKRISTLGTDELAQMISLLPPATPENLDNRTGKPVALGKTVPGGVYRRTTEPAPGHIRGIDYLVKLPPEYHHGRAYPVLIVLTHPGIDAEDILGPLMSESEKHGYIVIAPEWAGQFARGGWQWRGEDHVHVTAALRNAVRHFTVDNDRVFMLGVGDGANMAMDIAMSHPDLFAGVVPMGPIPKWGGMFIEYWKNAQKLPFYVVSGEQSGEGITNVRKIYEQWTRYGYPAIWSVYKGRGIEWFAAETAPIFDWMSRKVRVNGTATLALGNGIGSRKPWVMLRDTDTRFYWLQADRIMPGKAAGAIPAEIQGDIRGNNLVVINTNRVKQLTVWLSSDMIDWTKPVRLQINGSTPQGWAKPKMFEPNIEVLLQDYHERGDRRMLFMNKIEISTVP